MKKSRSAGPAELRDRLDETTYEKFKSDMKDELKKNRPDMDHVRSLMEVSVYTHTHADNFLCMY